MIGLACQQSVFQRYRSRKRLLAFYPQNGGESLLASKLCHCHAMYKHIHTHARTHACTHAHTHTHTHTHTSLTAICPGLPRWAGTRKVKPNWILLKQRTVSGNGISWAICKFAPCSRQITTPAPHHSVFYRPPNQVNQQRQSTEGTLCININGK